MTTIKKFTTKELMEELSLREGVEKIVVAPHTQQVEVAVNEGSNYPYDKIHDGPCIVLLIKD